jgi:hypothetical protein
MALAATGWLWLVRWLHCGCGSVAAPEMAPAGAEMAPAAAEMAPSAPELALAAPELAPAVLDAALEAPEAVQGPTSVAT